MSIEDLCYECFPNLIVAIKTLQHGDKLPSYKDNHGFWVLWLQFSVALLPLELFAGAEWHFAMLIFASWANTFNDADKCIMWGLIAFMRSIQTDLKTMTRSTSFYISMAGVTLDDKNLVHLFKNKWPLMYQNHIRNVTVDLCGVEVLPHHLTLLCSLLEEVPQKQAVHIMLDCKVQSDLPNFAHNGWTLAVKGHKPRLLLQNLPAATLHKADFREGTIVRFKKKTHEFCYCRRVTKRCSSPTVGLPYLLHDKFRLYFECQRHHNQLEDLLASKPVDKPEATQPVASKRRKRHEEPEELGPGCSTR
jgi:hypothetical protein